MVNIFSEHDGLACLEEAEWKDNIFFRKASILNKTQINAVLLCWAGFPLKQKQ